MNMDALINILTEKGYTISFAESCTGGMFGAAITEKPGSSAYFLGSAVTYSDESKENILGVCKETLEDFGAVSYQVAEEMALGSKRIYGSDYAVAITGIAGPEGATDIKPVGRVYIAVTDGEDINVRENNFKGSRVQVRQASVDKATEMLFEMVSQ